MPSSASARARWMALAGAALLLSTVAAIAVHRQHAQQPAPPPVAARAVPPPSGGGCNVPKNLSVRSLSNADDPPVLLWAVGKVHLFVDGEPAFSPPEAPKHYAVGPHTLRAEAEGAASLTTRFQLDAYTPALFHAELDGPAGLTLVKLGASCASCAAADTLVTLTPERSHDPSDALLRAAAEALRMDKWVPAAASLRRVPAAQRGSPLFLRLSSALYVDTVQPELARKVLSGLRAGSSNDLTTLLKAYDALETSEQKRRSDVLMQRWNKLTEKFATLAARFGGDAAGPVQTATRRLEALSHGFEAAQRDHDARREEEAMLAAEQSLLELGRELLAARPTDCAFQTDVVALLQR